MEELKPRPESVSLIFTDPPWGQDETTLALWRAWVRWRLGARPGGLLLTYCGQAALPRWLEILGRHLTYRWQIVCVNAAGHSIAPTRGGYGILNGYRCLLLFSKGPSDPHRSIKDTLMTDGARRACTSGSSLWPRPCTMSSGSARRADWSATPSGAWDDRACRPPGRWGGRFLGGDPSVEAVRVARRRVAGEEKAGRRAVPEAVDEVAQEMATV